MNNRRMLIIGGLVAVLLIAIPLTVYIASQQQDVRSNAANTLADVGITPTLSPTSTPTLLPTSTPIDSPTPSPTPTVALLAQAPTPVSSGSACQTPEVVSGVDISYPSCQGTQCSFAQASCTWASVNGATTYSISITQIESATVTKTDTVTAPTASYIFDVEQGKTYKCDIAALNSCGNSGPAGSAQALCAVDGQVGTPTPRACFYTPCDTTVNLCQAGFVCVSANNGSKYCANASYQANCASNPTYASCCSGASAPAAPPAPVVGDTNMTILLGIGGTLAAIAGGLLFLFSGI